MNIPREINKIIPKYLFQSQDKKRAVIIYGARQVGKTTLAKEILKQHSQKSQYFNCDYFDVQETFSHQKMGQISKLVKNLELIVLDEAQRLENVGLILKILVDEFPHLQVIATGSSSFELSNKINEPLTGRKVEIKLFPFSVRELWQEKNFLQRKQELEQWLIFGSYPVAILSDKEKTEIFLKELTDSYLFKDIFAFQKLKKPEILHRLLQLLAFQLGQEVSYQELALKLNVDQTVVQKYLDLLEKAFVIFRLSAFSRNLRNEVTKTRKIYFYDLGVRNTLIQNYNSLNLRDDIGALWENFCLSERLKYLEVQEKTVNQYFWRTYTQKEIDYIEEDEGKLNTFEFKWQGRKKISAPREFLETYPQSTFQVIDQENFEEFLGLD